MDDFDKEFYGTSGPPVEPTAAPAPSRAPTVDEFDREFYGTAPQRPVADRTTAPPPADAATKAPAKIPTRFQKARTAPVQPEKELTFSEAIGGARKSFLPSVGGVLKSTASIITDPAQTLAGLREIGRGVISKGASAVGVEQTPEERARNEQVLNSMIDQYAQTYGSKQGFYKALSQDPASILMDFATVVSGGAGAAGKAGLISEKAAMDIARRASFVDPVQLAIKGAKVAGTGTAKVARGVSAIGTGVAPRYLQVATEVGSKGTPDQVALFRSMQKDPSKQIEIVDMALEGVKKAADERSAQYLAGKGGLSKTADVDFTDAGVRLGDLRDQFTQKMTRGPDVVLDEGAMSVLNDIEKKLISFAQEPPGSPARSIVNADRLKQSIGTIRDNARGNKQAYRVATDMYNQIRDSIAKADPKYMRVMQEYEDMSDFLSDLRQGFGVGKSNIADATILRRLTKADSPAQRDLLEKLGKYAPDLKYAIAGAATSEWIPGGIRQALLGSLPFYGFGAPMAAAGHLAASSPRLAGTVALRAGQIGKYGSKVTQPLVTTPAYFAGRAGQETAGGEPAPATEKSEFEEYFGPVVSQDDTFEKMLDEESGNRQFDERGNTILGPEVKTGSGIQQAVGAAQVLPTTGPEAAEAAGLEWDENRFRNDMEYNVALGRAYFEKQLQAFGDPRKAAAAYNAGPERVRQAMRKADQEGGSFEDYLPTETKNYLAKVFGAATGGRIERKSGGRVESIDGLVDQLMMRVRKAKKETTKATEPLLNQPDEHIVRALDIAQQAI